MDHYKELSELIKARVRRKKNTIVQVIPIEDGKSFHAFVADRKESIEQSYNTILQSKPHKEKLSHYVLYKCIRGNKGRGKVKRKSVGCKFYASFEKKTTENIVFVIETIFPYHSGHDELDNNYRKIDKDLLKEIEKFARLGVKNDTILTLAHHWAQEHGHFDPSRKSYYVTPEDIAEIKRKMSRSASLDKNDAISTYKMLETVFKEETVYYQKFDKATNTPLIIVLQEKWMEDKMNSCARNLVFLDATHSLTQYGFSLHALCVRDEFGFGVPIAYIISSSYSDGALSTALEKLRLNASSLCPR